MSTTLLPWGRGLDQRQRRGKVAPFESSAGKHERHPISTAKNALPVAPADFSVCFIIRLPRGGVSRSVAKKHDLIFPVQRRRGRSAQTRILSPSVFSIPKPRPNDWRV